MLSNAGTVTATSLLPATVLQRNKKQSVCRRERERERESVCVCVGERERERDLTL